MEEPVIEVLDYGPEEDHGSSWRSLGRGRLSLLIVALVVGALVGAGTSHAIGHHKPAPAAAPVGPTPVDAVVLASTVTSSAASTSGVGVTTNIDFAVINEGNAAISSVVAQWQSLDATPAGAQPSVQTLGQLPPDSPTTVRLPLVRSCGSTSAAPVPALLLTWSRDGAPQRLVVAPFGLDRIWAGLEGYCVTPQAAFVPPDISVVKVTPVRADTTQLELGFRNRGDDDIPIAALDISGAFARVVAQPRFIVARANTSTVVTITVKVENCQSAIERSYTAGLSYSALSGPATVNPIVMTDELSRTLGELIYRACGHA